MKLMRDQSAGLVPSNPSEGSLASPPSAPRNAAAPAAEPALFRPDLQRSLQLHRGLALGIALLGLLGAVAYVYSIWPVFTAEATLYVQPAPPRVMDNGYTTHWPFDTNTYESFISQQMVTVTRTDVLVDAVHKLGSSWQRSTESDQEAAARLGHAVDVKRMGTSYQMVVSARSSNPIVAAQLANAVAEAYIENETRESKSGNNQRKATLQEEKDRVLKELDGDRAEQLELNKKLGVAAAGATPDHYDEDLSRMRLELVRARAENDASAAALTSMDKNRATSAAALDAEADQIVSADPGLVSMKTTLYQRRATLTSQMANLTPNHPLYKQDAEELAKINKSIDSLSTDLRAKAEARIQQRLRTDLERTSGVEARLNAQLGQMAGAAASATPKLQRENDLAADIVRLQNRYTAVDEQLHNLALETSAPGASFLAAAATPPLSPTKSGVLRNAIVIAFAGIFFGLLAAIAANKLDQKVYIASDVEQVLGFAPMAVLPDFDQVSDGVAEEHLLRLAAGIEFARQSGNLKSCIFTGAGNGVGTTTVSSKVRSMLEGMGRATVLVDASGTPPPPQRSSYEEAGKQETASQLSVQRGSRSTALVQQMAQESATQEGSLVVSDTAPLAVSAETEYLARYVDAAIVVVESGVTTRKQLRETADTLQRLDVAAVGFVLNRVGLQKADPAFRDSVQAIERHLHAQSNSYSRGPERSRPSAAPAKTQVEEAPREMAAPVKAEAALPRPPSEAPVRPPFATVSELAAAARQQAPFEPWGAKTSRIEDLIQSTTPPLSTPAARPMQHETPLVQPADSPRPAESSLPMRGRDPQVAAERTFSASDFGSVVRPQSVPQPPAGMPQSPWAESWKRVSPRADEVQPRTGQGEQPEPGLEESPYDAATRMSGLRNLIFSLGLKNPQQPDEAGEPHFAPPPPPEPVRERPVYAQVTTPVPEAPVGREAYRAPSAQVVASPEILPPRTIEVNTDGANVGTPRRDRRDPFDDVQILPSWRGQYRKR